MAVSPSKKSGLIAARDLAAAVDSAIAAASKRVGLDDPDKPSPLITKWDIVGRYMRDRATAEAFAKETASAISSSSGVKADPAVLIVNKKILAGFIERGNGPLIREIQVAQGGRGGGASPYSCPSAQPDMEEARVFGVVGGTAEEPRVAYLKADAQVTPEMMERLGGIDPTHVFRFAGRCEETRCAQFANGRCTLGERIAAMLPPVAEALPSCQIRSSCRWFAEIGRPACLRCPQVVTLVPSGQTDLGRAAQPAP